jgi:hypothetical protein
MSLARCAVEILREWPRTVKAGKAAPAGDSSIVNGVRSIPDL